MTDTRPTIVLTTKFPERLVAALEARYCVLGPMTHPLDDAIAALPHDDARAVRAVLTQGTVGISRRSISALPRLGLVGCYGSGYEGVDLAAARERGIVCTHSPGANASSVADLAIGLMIASVRRMFDANAYLRRGEWGQRGRRRLGGRGLTGRRIGIYGLGAIGEKVARRAEALEMEVGYHNRRQRSDVRYPYFATLADLATWAEVLMITARAGPENRHAVDAGILRALGPDAHVVNIARGSVVDETALIAALTDETIAGAGLDVFEREPQVPESLRSLPNVALTPHIGGDTTEAEEAMAAMVLANFEAFFAGQPPPTPVPE